MADSRYSGLAEKFSNLFANHPASATRAASPAGEVIRVDFVRRRRIGG